MHTLADLGGASGGAVRCTRADHSRRVCGPNALGSPLGCAHCDARRPLNSSLALALAFASPTYRSSNHGTAHASRDTYDSFLHPKLTESTAPGLEENSAGMAFESLSVATSLLLLSLLVN